MGLPTRIFIDRERVAQVKAAHAAGTPVQIPLFKIRRTTGLVRATSFTVRDSTGRVLVRGMSDPSGKVCGATVWVEIPEDVDIEFG